jgi:phosphate transport system ATP-binding protein
MTSTPHISVRNLDIHIGKDHILKNINLDIPKNKLTSVIGPSGCGKSTLLRTLNRLLERTEGVAIHGEVLLNGENIYGNNADVTQIRQKMGLLSQRPFPLPMSIFENIVYGPKLHNYIRKKTQKEMVERFLKATHLWEEVKDRLHSPASGLSIGQQQRLCLARGLAVNPEIILGDEPTSALDPISSQRVEELFMQLKNEYTIVLVTHILRQAKRISDYVVFMYLGEVIEYGPAEEIFLNPKMDLTKEYMKGGIS